MTRSTSSETENASHDTPNRWYLVHMWKRSSRTYLHLINDFPSVLDAQNGYVLGLFGQQQLVQHFQRAVLVLDGLQSHRGGRRRTRLRYSGLSSTADRPAAAVALVGRVRSLDATSHARTVNAKSLPATVARHGC